MADPYIGEIRLFAGVFAPRDWFFCDGSLRNINEYQALYSLIATIYGGDGRTTFGLPDLRGRVPIGTGQGPGLSFRSTGQMPGMERVSLDEFTIPSHSHDCDSTTTVELKATTEKGTVGSPANQALLAAGDNVETTPAHSLENYVTNPEPDTLVEIKGPEASFTVNVQDTGGNQSHENMQPWIAINYIICHEGLYPPRT